MTSRIGCGRAVRKRVWVLGLASASACVAPRAQAAWAEVTTLTRPADAPFPDDTSFGQRATCSGDTVVVGAPNEDNYKGAVYVYSGPGYASVTRVTPPDPGSSDQLGGSLSLSGDTLLVGSSKIDNGWVRFFVREGGAWQHQQTITPTGPARTGSYGRTLVVRGDVAVVSSPKEQGDLGRVYVYRRANGTWAEEAQLAASDGMTSDFFGFGLAFDGTTVAVTAPTNPLDDSPRGAVYFFTRVNGSWAQEARFDLSGQNPTTPALWFGNSVAVSGNHALVASNGGTDTPVAPHAHAFERGGAGWQLVQTLPLPNFAALTNVSMQGQRVFGMNITGDDRRTEELQRTSAGWAPSQTLAALPGLFDQAICGKTLIRAAANVVHVYTDDTVTEADPTVPPKPAAASGDGDGASEEGGCSVAAQRTRGYRWPALAGLLLLGGLARRRFSGRR